MCPRVNWAHCEVWEPRVVLGQMNKSVVTYWSSVCVDLGGDKEPGQAEMELTILLIGFCQGRRWVGAPAPVWAGAAYVRAIWAGSGISVPLYLGSVVVRRIQGGPRNLAPFGGGGLWRARVGEAI